MGPRPLQASPKAQWWRNRFVVEASTCRRTMPSPFESGIRQHLDHPWSQTPPPSVSATQSPTTKSPKSTPILIGIAVAIACHGMVHATTFVRKTHRRLAARANATLVCLSNAKVSVVTNPIRSDRHPPSKCLRTRPHAASGCISITRSHSPKSWNVAARPRQSFCVPGP